MKNLFYFLFIAVAGLAGCTPKTRPDSPAAPTPAPDQPAAAAPTRAADRTILFFGNSLTAGYGLDPAQAFPALIQRRIDSLGLGYKVVNAGLSGETTAGGRARISWVLRQPVAVFVLELGANDGLRGIEPADTRRNLQAIVDTVKARNPGVQVVVAGMQMPPNLGASYTSEFRKLFPALSEKNDALLIPFLLEGVAGIPSLNLPDGIHPTAKGHRRVAETVWRVLGPVLSNRQE